MKPEVAVVIVTYNSERQIGDCLRSVIEQRRKVRQEIIVLDNSPNDATVRVVREQFPEVNLVIPGRNLGFAAGVNEAVRHTQAEFILLLNPDTVILNHAVDTVVDFARANPGHGLYGGRTLKSDGSLEPSSCWGLPSLWSMAMFATGLSAVAPRSPIFHPEGLGGWQRDTVREVGVITGCFLLAPRQVWNELGGFDERFFMYGEDADLAARARALGYSPIICPKAELIHDVGQSSETPLHKALLLYRGKASYVRTHWSGARQKLGLMLLAFGVGLRALGGMRRTRSHRSTGRDTWSAVWKQRHDWLQGYPKRTSSAHPEPVLATYRN